MITFEQFLWLIHYALLALYGWEIAYFALYRITQPAAYQQIAPGIVERFWDANATGALTLVMGHIIAYGITVHAVPIFLIVYVGVSIYCTGQNEGAKPLLQKGASASGWALNGKLLPFACAVAVYLAIMFTLQNDKAAHLVAVFPALGTFWLVKYLLGRRPVSGGNATAQEQHSPGGARADESDFQFDEDRFGKRSSSSSGQSSSYDPESDYQNALIEAQKWADQASSRENAVQWASKFEKLADNPALHAKDKLRYRLAAMLLRERLKGQDKAAPGGAAGADPTDADVSRLGLPVPPR